MRPAAEYALDARNAPCQSDIHHTTTKDGRGIPARGCSCAIEQAILKACEEAAAEAFDRGVEAGRDAEHEAENDRALDRPC